MMSLMMSQHDIKKAFYIHVNEIGTFSAIQVEVFHSTTICKLVDLILALHQSDGRIPN